MADLVSPIIDIISRLWPCCARHTRYLCKLQENKDLLRTAMDKLKDAKNDVQRRVIEEEADPNESKKRTDSVSRWLQSVEKIEGEVEVILQKADEEQLSSRGRCLGGCCPPNKCWSNYKLGKSIAKKILPFVDELKVNGKFEEVTYRLPSPTVQPMNLESTVGMESMFDKVWKYITSKNDNKGNIIGLYGHGGVGKTTLLKKLNNEFNKISGGHGFDHIVMFVVVSQRINYEAIQNKIGERLGLTNSLKGDGDESSRADKIFNQLRNKSFVILLDDIWERVDLQRIGIPSPPSQGQGGSSSKVIFTTRSERVCGLMEATYKFKVECLPWDKAWSLFQEKVGEEALTCFPRAREIAKDVAKQCGGLPLALITIGRAMSTTKSAEEWKDAITTLRNSASEFEGMSDDILPRLKLSYDNLRNDTFKSCFRYCAIYPEDHRIDVPQLIDQWIAEGILNRSDNNLDGARCYGHLVIETLKRACLLESCEEKETDVKMHDIIRDLALWIVNDCKSSSNATGKFLVASDVCERWRNAERIFWDIHTTTSKILQSPDNFLKSSNLPIRPQSSNNIMISSNLRTLLVLHDNTSNLYHRSHILRVFIWRNPGMGFSLPQNFFQFTPFLRVLDMSHTQLQELPTSICELYELQYLNLSFTKIKELPIELRKLEKLKFLDLTYAWDLVKIPPGVIANLSELQVLKLARSGFTDWGLKEEDGDGNGGGLSFGELDRLKQLQEVTLTISTSLAAFEDLLKSLGELDRICTALVFESCVNLKSISFGNLICLKDLQINSCVELEELILLFINNEGGETNTTTTTTTSAAAAAGLPINSNNKLEQLILFNLPKLNNIVWGEKYHHYMAAAQQQQHYLHYYASPFQNLHHIYIESCDALKDLTWVAYVESLKHLDVRRCKGIETIIVELGGGDDDGGGLEEEGASGGGGGGRVVFSSLKTLVMWDVPNLKSICSHALLFPSIERIIIFHCPELKKLPLDSRSNINNTLQKIESEPNWWSELQWEDETTKSKFLPYFQKYTGIW